MKFLVTRTSSWKERPCDEAKAVIVPCYDQRTFKSPEEHDKKIGQKWFDLGTEHSVNRFGIVRRLEDRTAWEIEINSLEDLLKFQDKYGKVIIKRYYSNNFPEIEIYDDNRE